MPIARDQCVCRDWAGNFLTSGGYVTLDQRPNRCVDAYLGNIIHYDRGIGISEIDWREGLIPCYTSSICDLTTKVQSHVLAQPVRQSATVSRRRFVHSLYPKSQT